MADRSSRSSTSPSTFPRSRSSCGISSTDAPARTFGDGIAKVPGMWNFDLPITWRELGRRTGKEMVADDCLGLAAQLSYYLFLALFPAILFLLALGSFFPLRDLAGS